MESERKLPNRQQDEATRKLLANLKQKLYAGDMSQARKAAHRLSWMQEDGFTILKEALFDNSSKSLKTAAAYGLRGMRGRMKKAALEAIKEGLLIPNRYTRDACKRTLLLLNSQKQSNSCSEPKQNLNKFPIKEIPAPGKTSVQIKTIVK